MQLTTFVFAALASLPFTPLTSARALSPRRFITRTVGLSNANFRISVDPAIKDEETSLQAFDVDLPAHECSLFAKFAPDFIVAQSSGSGSGSGGAGLKPLINVIDVNGPAPGAIVGTFKINQDGAAHPINTFVCRDPLTVRFEISADNGLPGSVSFQADEENGIFVNFTPEGSH